MLAASLMYCSAISFLKNIVFVPDSVSLTPAFFSTTPFTKEACSLSDRSVPLSSFPSMKYLCLLFQASKSASVLFNPLSGTVAAQKRDTPCVVQHNPPESSINIFIGLHYRWLIVALSDAGCTRFRCREPGSWVVLVW